MNLLDAMEAGPRVLVPLETLAAKSAHKCAWQFVRWVSLGPELEKFLKVQVPRSALLGSDLRPLYWQSSLNRLEKTNKFLFVKSSSRRNLQDARTNFSFLFRQKGWIKGCKIQKDQAMEREKYWKCDWNQDGLVTSGNLIESNQLSWPRLLHCPRQAQGLVGQRCGTHGERRPHRMGRPRTEAWRCLVAWLLQVIEQQAPCCSEAGRGWEVPCQGMATDTRFVLAWLKSKRATKISRGTDLESGWLHNTAQRSFPLQPVGVSTNGSMPDMRVWSIKRTCSSCVLHILPSSVGLLGVQCATARVC